MHSFTNCSHDQNVSLMMTLTYKLQMTCSKAMTSWSTTASTAVANFVAAVITYPAESRRLKMTEEILQYWNPKDESAHINRNLRVVTPLVRLSLNEMARGFVSDSLTTTTSSSKVAKWFLSDIERQIQALFIAGVSQTLHFTPFEFWRAKMLMYKEQEYSSKWKNKLYSQEVEESILRARVIRALVAKSSSTSHFFLYSTDYANNFVHHQVVT